MLIKFDFECTMYMYMQHNRHYVVIGRLRRLRKWIKNQRQDGSITLPLFIL